MKWVYYIILLFTLQFFNAMLGSYSSTKHEISLEFNFTERFFGIVDMVSMLGRLISSVYIILIPSEKINKTFFICALIQTVSMLILASSHFMKGIAQFLFILGMLVFGLGRGIYSFPFLLLSPIFNQPEDVSAVNIWYGVGSFGTNYAFLMYIWFKDSFNMHWTIIILITAFINMFFSSLTFKFVPEVERDVPAIGICEGIQRNKEVIKEHYQRKTSNWLLLLDFLFQENITFVFLFWAPYFFMKMGFSQKAAIIGLCLPSGCFIGSLLLNPLIALCSSFTHIITCIFVFIKLLLLISLFFIQPTIENFAFYILIFGLFWTLHIVPYSKESTNQITEKTISNEEKYLIINFMRLARQLLSALSLLIIGIILNINLHYIWGVFLVHDGIGFTLHIIRRIVEYRERQQNNERQEVQERLSNSSD